MKTVVALQRFEQYLREGSLKLTPQRRRIFDRVFATHDHFSAERLYDWLRDEEGPGVSRATVYRTLDMLEKGGFIQSLELGRGELVYEHVLGHSHHDHMVCVVCGRIQEFREPAIEELQLELTEKRGFLLTGHLHRLMGVCRSCAAKLTREGRLEEVIAEHRH